MSDSAIQFRNVSRHFGDVKAVNDVSLEIKNGEFFSMLGPSGSGKTTCLRMIAGFDRPTSGQIFLYGQDVSHLPPYERSVNTVFQDYALFPHMTIEENVGYGLMIKGISKADRAKQVDEMLELVQLPGFGGRKPSQLSGGQRQRVALARALVKTPDVLLLDEPLGALDLKLRKEMQLELKALQQQLGITFIYVTHDQEEALEVSDRVVVINRGQVEQIGTPESVYDHPATPFVANFLGSVNLFHGRVENGHLHVGDDALALGSTDGSDGKAVAFVRPHEFDLVPGWEARGGLPARIVRIVSVGPSAQIELTHHDGELIEVTIGREAFRLLGLSEGDQVSLRPRHIRVFPSEAQAA